jgi:hypothetical protein
VSLDDVNEAIRTGGGGGFTKLSNKGDVLEGILLDVKVQEKWYDGAKVLSKAGQPRIEWLFTIETPDGIRKYSAMEGAQSAVRNAIAEANVPKLEKGGKIRFELTQEYIKKVQFAEFKVSYTPPKFAALPDDDEAPF